MSTRHSLKPVIGIVSRVCSDGSSGCVESIRKTVIKMGGIPLLILPLENKVELEYTYSKFEQQDLTRLLKICDGFIVPGGELFTHLDELVIRYAIKEDKPLLGICLGMQILSKVLINDDRRIDNTMLNNSQMDHYQPDKQYCHYVNIAKDSKLFKILGQEKILVNSRHNYHVPDMPSCYIAALSEDGLIEGVELKSKTFIIGVQWHPESLLSTDKNAYNLFYAFFKAINSSQKFHQKKR